MMQRIMMIVLIVGIVLGGGSYAYKQLVPPPDQGAQGPVYATKEVVRGDITVGVETSGPLNPSRGGSIQVPGNRVGGTSFTYTVEEVLTQEGQEVSQGQPILRLSSPDLLSKIEQLEKKIADSKKQLADLLNVPVGELGRINPAQGITLNAPIGGRIIDLKLREGEEIKQGQIVAKVVDDSTFRLTAKLNKMEFAGVKEGQTAYLTFPLYDGRIEAKVTEINSDPIPELASELLFTSKEYSGSGRDEGQHYVLVHWVTIEGNNPGLIMPGMMATIELNNRTIFYKSKIEGYVQESQVLSRADAIATKVYAKNMQRVEQGAPLVSLAGEDARSVIQKHLDDISDMESELGQLYNQVNNLTVTSPMDGVVGGMYANVGQTVQPGDWLGHIYNTSDMNLWVQIDDLDVLLVRQGAPVKISLDALPGNFFEGEVRHVSSMGFGYEKDGMSRFQVDIQVKGSPEMRPGMMATAHIEGGSAQGVLLIPIEAVFEDDGQMKVEVLHEDGRVQLVSVELGLMDSRWAEVKSGLEEGQQVVVGSSYDLLPSQQVKGQESLMPAGSGEGNKGNEAESR